MSFDYDFVAWLKNKLGEREMKPRDLALAAKIDPGSMSRFLNYERKPSAETLVSIADALKVSRYEVFEAAGYMNNKDDISPEIESLAYRISKLPKDQQKIIDAMIDAVLKGQGN